MMKEAVTTLPGSLGVNPPEWTTAHKDYPPEWLHQEGHPCMIGGRTGTMEIVDGRLICVTSPTPKEAKMSLAQEARPSEDHYTQGIHLGHWEDGHRDAFMGHPHDSTRGGSFQQAYDRGYQVGSNARADAFKWQAAHRNKESTVLSKELTPVTEGVNLRFASSSRTQIAKAAVYWMIGTRKAGVGNIKVSPIEGTEGNWYFDVSSNEDDQFLDPGRLNNIVPAEVTVTKTSFGPKVGQTASQVDIKTAIREMVEKRLSEQKQEV